MSDLDKNKENSEENNKQKVKVDLKGKFTREFSKDILSGNDKNKFLDETMKKDTIESNSFLEKEINKFQSKNSEFNDFDQKKLTIYDLQRQVGKQYSSLEFSRASYLESTFPKYDLNEKQREKLEKEIEKKSEVELKKLINLEAENNKLINKIFGENKIDRISDFKFLGNITEFETKSRLDKLSDSDKNSVKTSLYNLKNFRAGDTDIRELFSTNFLKKNEKKLILSQFIPYLTLEKAKELGLFDKTEAEKKKNEILKPLLEKKGLSGDVLDNALKSASLEDIKIKSSEFFNDETNLNIISEGVGFINFEKDLKEIKKDILDDIDQNGPKSLEELRQILSGEEFNNSFENIDSFKEGNIIKTITRNKEGTEVISYGKIQSVSDLNKKINIKWVGDNSTGKEVINLNVQNISENISFADIVNNFKGEGKKANFYTETELNKIIEDPKNNIETSDLKQYTPKDLHENPGLVENLQEKYHSQKELERQILEDEVEGLENEISNLKLNINDENKSDSENQIKILETSLSQKKLLLVSQIKSTDTSISTNDLLQFSNKLELVKKLDELDSEGKSIMSPNGRTGLFAGMYITTKDGIYKITGVDWEYGKVELESQGKKGLQKESLTFEGFYQAFKKNDAKRMKPMSSTEDFLKDNQENSENKEAWSNFIVKNGKLVVKEVPEYSKDKNPEVEYLISDGSDEIFKIEDITGDKITFKWGERKKIDKLGDKEKKKYKNNIKLKENGSPEKNDDGSFKYDGELLSLSKSSQTMNLTEFNKLINNSKKEEFYPDWETGKIKTIVNPQSSENKFGGSFMTKLFNNLSLSEVLDGGKMMVENIEEYMKKGNDIHAAQVALKFGKMLPDEVYQDLKIKVERAESESMDKEIESLGKVDSWIAADRIKGWLENKDTPEYKKEAGLMFMIKKYGHLTAKTGLSELKGKFFWYESFGGKIGDKLFLDLKKEADEKNQTFSEEYLMYVFIKKQCGEKGYGGIRRRTRLHKEYKSSWPQGVEDEIKTGHTDASDERTARSMVDGGIGEMTGGTISNGVGWFQKAIERGGTLEDMSEGFFTLLYSGAIYNLDQKTYLKIKGLWDGEGIPIIMARFSSFKSDMDLFNETVLEISNRIGDEYADEFPNIKTEAKQLFIDAKSGNGKEKDRILRAQKFWKTYGKPLSRALNMNHSGDNTYSKTDKIVYLESGSNSTLKKYYDSIRGFATEGSFKKDFMDDAMGDYGVGGLNTNQITKQFLKMDVGGSLKEGKAGGTVWKNISNDINKVGSMDLNSNLKKKYLIKTLRDIFAGFLSNHGGREDALKSYNNNTSDIGQSLNSWGINVFEDFGKFSAGQINDESNGDVNYILNRVADNILSGNSVSDGESYISGFKPANNIKYKTKDETEEILAA